jgi:hypothetical protein
VACERNRSCRVVRHTHEFGLRPQSKQGAHQLTLTHHDEQAVLRAVELVLIDSAPTKTHILNVLHRLIDDKSATVSPIEAPQALTLDREPRADVDRYDSLRDAYRRPAMRHDPAGAAIVIMLRSLKMYGMAQAASKLMEQGAPAFEAAIPILSQLLKAETAEREGRSVAYQIKEARFPAYKDLSGYDFASSEINEALVCQLHRCEFLASANNIVLVGDPGTGKPMSQQPSASRRSSIIVRKFGFLAPYTW